MTGYQDDSHQYIQGNNEDADQAPPSYPSLRTLDFSDNDDEVAANYPVQCATCRRFWFNAPELKEDTATLVDHRDSH
jgi:hypothetical protein